MASDDEFTMSVSGLAELGEALDEMKRSTAAGVLRRSLVKAAAPIADEAARLAPVDTGELSGSIIITTKTRNTKGYAEYRAVMKGGGTKDQARAAFLDARRNDPSNQSFVKVLIGPEYPDPVGPFVPGGRSRAVKDLLIKRYVQEFGSIKQAARPYMRPAYDAGKTRLINDFKGILAVEIDKTVKRAAARAAKKAERLA